MARPKKDGRFINYYIDRTIYERLERYAEDKSQPVTAALERILDEHLTRYEAEMASMERYCPACHILVRDTRCPVCGKRWLEAPEPGDYCRLTEREGMWAGVLEETLRRSEIPYQTESLAGAWKTARLGIAFEKVRFYVRYADLARARELDEALFTEQEDEA